MEKALLVSLQGYAGHLQVFLTIMGPANSWYITRNAVSYIQVTQTI